MYYVVYITTMDTSEEEKSSLNYRHEEPTIIDDEMLTQAVYEQGPQQYAGLLAQEEGIEFVEVTKLRLSFRSKFA